MAQNSHRRGQSISAADFYENPHLSCLPEPLTIRKTPSQQLPNIRAHSPINEPHPLQEHAEKSIFPPRTSSVGLAEQEAAEFLRRHEKNDGRQNSDSSGHRTTISSTRSRHHTSATGSTSNSVARSTGSNFSGHYSSGASAEIMGNFVPVGEDDVQMSGPLTEVTIPFREAYVFNLPQLIFLSDNSTGYRRREKPIELLTPMSLSQTLLIYPPCVKLDSETFWMSVPDLIRTLEHNMSRTLAPKVIHNS